MCTVLTDRLHIDGGATCGVGMARRRKASRRQRVARSNANLGLLPRPTPPRSAIEDRRQFHPVHPAPPRSFPNRTEYRIAAATSASQRQPGTGARGRPSLFLSPHVAFRAPGRVLICIRRKVRREVLHAKGVAGGRVSRRRRRNENSNISCKR